MTKIETHTVGSSFIFLYFRSLSLGIRISGWQTSSLFVSLKMLTRKKFLYVRQIMAIVLRKPTSIIRCDITYFPEETLKKLWRNDLHVSEYNRYKRNTCTERSIPLLLNDPSQSLTVTVSIYLGCVHDFSSRNSCCSLISPSSS